MLGTIGRELRAARLRRGEDLATVSQALKIRKDHLNALEEDKFEALPGRTYAVGFVRSYAEYLGLDVTAAVERFKEEIAGRNDGSYQITLVPDEDERRVPRGWVVMAIVLVGIIAYAVYHLSMSSDALLRQPVAPVPARIAPQPPVAASVGQAVPHHGQSAASPASAAPTVASARPATATGSQSPVQTSVSTGRQVAPVHPVNKPVAGSVAATASTPAVPKNTPPTVTPAPKPDTTGAAKGQEYGGQNTEARIVIHVKTATRVLVQGPDGKVFIDRMLQPGDSYRVPDQQGLTLTTSDGGAVGLEVDGHDEGSAGKQGQVTEALPLDPQAVMDRYNQASPNQGN